MVTGGLGGSHRREGVGHRAVGQRPHVLGLPSRAAPVADDASDADYVGRGSYGATGGVMIRRFLELGVSKTAIAKLTGVSRTALYSFMNTRGLRPSR